MTEFPLRQIGHTGLQVTELGLGCATLGGSQIAVARAAAEEIVGAAWAAGVRYVDTAPYYGVGQAERCVGDALRDRPRGEWVLSTKVGRLLRRNPTGAFADVMRSFEDSFQRLGLARIDILYVHDIGAYQHGAEANAMLMKTLRESGYRALETLRTAGELAAIGVGVNEREVLLEAMEWGAWDVFLLAGRYTLLEQAPLDDLLPKCVAAGTSIVVGGPLNSGILAGRDTWNYRPAPSAIVERVTAIAGICDAHRVPLAAAALQFPLAHPAVAAIIPGPRNAAEFSANLELLRHPIPPALWADLRQAGLLHPEAPVPRPA